MNLKHQHFEFCFIEKQTEFEKLCSQVFNNKIIAIDTEFERRTTFYPKMSLMQITSNNKNYIIDLISVSIESARGYLESEDIIKIIHSSSEDIEGIFSNFNIKIKNILDTQIIAKLIGCKKLGYKHLLEEFLRIHIDKTERMSNWMLRPLSLNQLKYSCRDTLFLLDLYKKMRNNPEIETYTKDINYCKKYLLEFENIPPKPEHLWLKFKQKHKIKNSRLALTALKCRQDIAIQYNLNVKLIASDAFIVHLTNSLDEDEGKKIFCKTKMEKNLYKYTMQEILNLKAC